MFAGPVVYAAGMARCAACGQQARQPFRQAVNSAGNPLVLGESDGVLSLVRVLGVVPGAVPGQVVYVTGSDVPGLLATGVLEHAG